MTFLALVTLPLVLLVLVIDDRTGGAGGASGGEKQQKAVPPAPPGQATRFVVTSPKPGETIKGSRVAVRFYVNGKLAAADQVLKDRADGLVHLHVLLDGGKWDSPEHTNSELYEVERAAGSHSPVIGSELVYRDLPPGTHQLRAELVHNDHNPASGLAEAALTFTTTK